MSFLRKITSAVSVAALVATSVGTSLTAVAASEFLVYADALAEQGVISAQSTESGYRLDARITRAEVAKIAVNLMGGEASECTGEVFSDVKASLGDLCGYIEAAADAGLVSTASATFRPSANVTRAEVIKMLLKAYEVEGSDVSAGFVDVTSSLGDLATYINAAAELGLINSGTYFRPNDTASRGEVFKISANLWESMTDDGDVDGGDTGTGTGTGTGTTGGNTGTTVQGTLTVGLNPASAPAQNVPQVGTVVFGKIDLMAGSSDVTVSGVKLYRGGLGNRSDISRVWFEKNGVRVSSRQSVSSDDSVNLTFSPALVVKAGATETVDLTVSLSGATNAQHSFWVKSSADVMASATVGGTFPLSTATMTTASYSVITAVFQTGGSESTYRAGDKNVEFGQFRITNNASDDKNASFKSIVVRNDGSGGDVNVNLGNLSLWRSGVKVSTSATAEGKYVTFALNDTIGFGRTETYYIRADVLSSENTTGDSYKFIVRNSEDVVINEERSGFRANISFPGNSQLTLSQYNVSGGDVIMSKSTSVVSSQTVAPGATDVVLWSADLKVAQPITFEDLPVTINATGSGMNQIFTTLKLWVGDSVVSTVTPNTASGSYTFDGTFTVQSTTTMKITGNVRSTNGVTGVVKVASVKPTDFLRKEYTTSGNNVQSAQLIGSADGVNTTIGTSTLTFTRNDGIASQSLTVGSNNVTSLQFTLKANDVSDVTVTRLKFGTGAGSSGSFQTSNVSNVKLYVDGTLVSTKSLSSGSADFNDLNFKVVRNGQVTVKVTADYTTAITNGQQLSLALVSGGAEARDQNGINLPSNGFVNSAITGPVYTFVTAGSVTLASNSATPNESILTPGTTEMEIARFTLGSVNDNSKLTDLYVFNSGATADLSSRIRTVALYNVSGTKLADGTPLGTNVIQFNLGNSSTFIVPKNTSASYVVVKAAFNDIDTSSNDATTVRLQVGTGSFTGAVTDGTVNGVRFVSEATGNNVTDVTGTAVGKMHLISRSKPVLAVSAAATNSTHTFTVSADANNRIFLSGVELSVQAPTALTFTLFKDQENIAGNVLATGSFATGASSQFVSFSGFAGVQSSQVAGALEVSAGSTKTFILQVVTSGTPTTNARRTLRITDAAYLNFLDIGSPNTTSTTSIKQYSNVGVPTTESVYVY